MRDTLALSFLFLSFATFSLDQVSSDDDYIDFSPSLQGLYLVMI